MFTLVATIDGKSTSLGDSWETSIPKNIVDVFKHVVILGPR
jgi:hypothetical protein